MKEALTLYCTVITRNFLSRAMTLHASLKAANPGAEFCALMVDENPRDGKGLEGKVPFRVLFADDLRDPVVGQMSRYYSPFEFTNAVRPRFFRYLFSVLGADKVIYLDSDIFVTGSLKPVEELLETHAIVYTPHVTQPPPMFPADLKTPKNMALVDYGFYNSGFQAYRRCRETDEALEFLAQRLRYLCFNWPPFMFCDQKWLDVVAALFHSRFHSLADPAYNIAYWNFYERPVELRDGEFRVGGRPVAFFHLSGFDPGRPERWTYLSIRVTREEMPAFDEVIRRYLELLGASRTALSRSGTLGRYDDSRLNGGKPAYGFSLSTLLVALHAWSLYAIANAHEQLIRRTTRELMRRREDPVREMP